MDASHFAALARAYVAHGLSLSPATGEDCKDLLKHIRVSDKVEARLSGVKPKEGIYQSHCASVNDSYAVRLADGKLLCVFGVSDMTMVIDKRKVRQVWLIATSTFDEWAPKHKRAVLVLGRNTSTKLRRYYGAIGNAVPEQLWGLRRVLLSAVGARFRQLKGWVVFVI